MPQARPFVIPVNCPVAMFEQCENAAIAYFLLRAHCTQLLLTCSEVLLTCGEGCDIAEKLRQYTIEHHSDWIYPKNWPNYIHTIIHDYQEYTGYRKSIQFSYNIVVLYLAFSANPLVCCYRVSRSKGQFLYSFFASFILACYSYYNSESSSIAHSKDTKRSELLSQREMVATSLWSSCHDLPSAFVRRP